MLKTVSFHTQIVSGMGKSRKFEEELQAEKQSKWVFSSVGWGSPDISRAFCDDKPIYICFFYIS